MTLVPIAAIAFAGCGSTSSTHGSSKPPSPMASAGGVEQVPVALTDFKVKPAVTRLKPGKVKFEVKNTGRVSHEFVVIDTSKPAAKLAKGKRASENGKVAEVGALKPGQFKVLVVKLRKGHYAVICNDPGHYMAGMHRDLFVT